MVRVPRESTDLGVGNEKERLRHLELAHGTTGEENESIISTLICFFISTQLTYLGTILCIGELDASSSLLLTSTVRGVVIMYNNELCVIKTLL